MDRHTTSGQTNGQTSTTSEQTSTTNGKMSTTSGKTSTTSGKTSTTSTASSLMSMNHRQALQVLRVAWQVFRKGLPCNNVLFNGRI